MISPDLVTFLRKGALVLRGLRLARMARLAKLIRMPLLAELANLISGCLGAKLLSFGSVLAPSSDASSP